MISLLLACALAMAQAPAPPSDVPLAHDPAGEQAVLDEAWRRVALGDAEGARALAASVTGFATETAYLIGVTWQIEARWPEALAAFQAVVTSAGDHPRSLDARFRMALAFDALGDWRAVQRTLRSLPAWSTLPVEDGHKVTLLDAVAAAERRASPRTVGHLAHAIASTPTGTLTWFQARGRDTLLRISLRQADQAHLRGGPPRLTRVLTARADALQRAEAQLQHLIALGESAFILDGLAALGEAYEAVSDDLLAAPVPRQLPEDEARRYTVQVQARAEVPRLKARNLYDLGLQHAGQVGWTGARVERLERDLARVTQHLEP